MENTRKKEAVKLQYKDDKIYITGASINGVLEISSKELKSMYWKGVGNGVIDVNIKV